MSPSPAVSTTKECFRNGNDYCQSNHSSSGLLLVFVCVVVFVGGKDDLSILFVPCLLRESSCPSIVKAVTIVR